MKRVVLVLACALLAAGCTGVPTSSSPQTVQALDTGSASGSPSIGPKAGADPDTIVGDFLTANSLDPDKHTSARAFLTAAARNRWSDDSATIISDESGGTFDAAKRTVTVYGRIVGTLSSTGVYTPSLKAEGDGGERVAFPFTLVRVQGQYRIDQLPRPGLLLTEDQFRTTFQQHVLYFFDTAEHYLVPDPRWSALTDRTQLADWLLTQLATGPRNELQNAVSNDSLPTQSDPHNVTVTLGAPTKVEIPGSSDLDPDVRNRLAAQVSESLADPVSDGPLAITDGGVPVTIPVVNGDAFSVSNFSRTLGPQAPDPVVYYLDGGRVLSGSGKPLAGPLGDGSGYLNSIALHRSSAKDLVVAGVEGSGRSARLAVGSAAAGVHPTSLHGELTRPAFAPGLDEAWVGAGPRLYRVTINGTRGQVQPVPIPAASGGGRILAVRFSPDGSRLALVVSGATPGSAQLDVGPIVREAGQVRVDTLVQISPEGVVVRDAAWLEPLKLVAIGYLTASRDARTFRTGVDGWDWSTFGLGNLPAPPDSVTATTQAAPPVWVSADNLVWQQAGDTQWISPVSTGQTPGTAPIYLE